MNEKFNNSKFHYGKDPYYESRFVYDPTRAVVWGEIVRHHSRFIPKDATVVDLGAGYCDFINLVSAKKKYAVDTSPELSMYAKEGIEKINALAWELSRIQSGTVDIIHASNLFEHFTDEELVKMMGEVKRVLKTGGLPIASGLPEHGSQSGGVTQAGKLILMQPNYRLAYKTYFDDPTHKKVFSDAALESFLIANGMNIILKKPKFLPFSLRSRPSIIPVHPLLIRAYINSPFKPFAGQMLFVSEKR